MANTKVTTHIVGKKLNGVITRNDSGAKHSAIRVYIARKVQGGAAVRKS